MRLSVPQSPGQNTVLNGKFVFDLRDFDWCVVIQERNPGIN